MDKKDECFYGKPEAASDVLSAWTRETLCRIQAEESFFAWYDVNRYLNTVLRHTGGQENMENMLKLRKQEEKAHGYSEE